MGTGLVTGYGFGHVIAQVQGQGTEAVDFELGGIFSAEGVDLSSELGESHCVTSSRKCGNRGDVRGSLDSRFRGKDGGAGNGCGALDFRSRSGRGQAISGKTGWEMCAGAWIPASAGKRGWEMCAGAWIPASAGMTGARERRVGCGKDWLGSCPGAWIPDSAGMTGWVRERDGAFRDSGHFRTNPALRDRRAGRGRLPGSGGERVALLAFLVI